MNRDQIEGRIRNLRGRGRSALGALGGRARPQVEGAYEQVSGLAQVSYGRLHDQAEIVQRDGRGAAEEAARRGRALRDEAMERGRDLRDDAGERTRRFRTEAHRHGRTVAARADENKATTLTLVAAAAFGLGLLLNRRR